MQNTSANLPEIRQKILGLDKVEVVSHLHVWSLTEEKMVVTVHVKVSDVRCWKWVNAESEIGTSRMNRLAAHG